MDENNIDKQQLPDTGNTEDVTKDPSRITPPPIPSQEEEWADRLGLDYNPEEAQRRAVPPPPPYPPIPQNGTPLSSATGQKGNQSQAPSPYPDPAAMPKTYLLWSVLSLVFCCFIPAIVAIVYSAKVSSKYYAGDTAGAEKASELAQIWIIVAIVTGVVTNTLSIPLNILMA